MLVFKDLQNKVYSGRKCVGFDYVHKNEKGELEFEARFKKGAFEKDWTMQVVLDRTRDADSQVYKFSYIMPKDNVPLELIAATGLKFFQLYLKEEVQKKIEFDFALGDILKGM